MLIEKEFSCGAHASGRTSGVLHAGFYYSLDSLKAKFARLGNAQLTTYCEEKQIPVNKCGKLVVVKDADDLPSLDELIRRGLANGIELQELTDSEAKTIEPRVRTYQRALFSPRTSTVNPSHMMNALQQDALREGIRTDFDMIYLGRDNRLLLTD